MYSLTSAEATLADTVPRTIENLLQRDAGEDVSFDFKEGVGSQDHKEKHRIGKAFVSFANGFGGFVFIGVPDRNNPQD